MTGPAAGADYSEEQLAIQRVVRDFARKEVGPGAEERDRTGAFDYALYRRLGGLGLPGMLFPGESGGSDADTLSFCLALQELSRVDMALGITLWVGITGARSIVSGGTDEQKASSLDSWILPTVRGEAVSAGAITEPDAGSDTASLRTSAVLDGDEWVINGSKIFITNVGLEHSRFVMVLARNPEGGFELVMVPKDAPGYTMGASLRKMSLRSSDTRERRLTCPGDEPARRGGCRTPVCGRFRVLSHAPLPCFAGAGCGAGVLRSRACPRHLCRISRLHSFGVIPYTILKDEAG